MDKISPLYPYILVKPIEEKLSEVVSIPDLYKKEPSRGVVVRLGPGISEVSEGDEIYFKELSGTYIDDLLLIPLDSVLLRLS